VAVHLAFNIVHPTNATNLFGNRLAGVAKKIKHKLEIVYVLYFGQFGILAMILYLTMQKIHLPYRLYRWLPIGSVCGHTYNQ
jgi:hypothetical protein